MTPPGRGGTWRPRRPDREEQRRRQQRKQRDDLEKKSFDPTPPTDEDWAIGDGSQMRRLPPPQPVGDALEAFLSRTGFVDRLRTTRLLEDWAGIVGEDLAKHTMPQRIERGVLHLAVSSNAWATQLTWMEATILEKVNEAAGRELVRHLRVVIGPVAPPA